MTEAVIRYDHYFNNAAERVVNQAKVGPGQTAAERDTSHGWVRTTTGWIQISTGGAEHALEQGIIAGGRNQSSETNNIDVTKHECNSTILDTQTTIQALSAGAPAYLMGITIHTALVGTLTITGLTNFALTATDWVIPVGAVGAFLPPGNARLCQIALSATLSNIADYGKCMVDWRSI